MAVAFRVKIDHPSASKFKDESPRDNFWNTLFIRAAGRSEDSDDESPLTAFWKQAAQLAEYARGSRESVTDPAFPMFRFSPEQFENRVERSFPVALEREVFKRLVKRGGLGRFDIKFACVQLEYASLEVILAALGLEKSADLCGLAMPAMMSIIEASVPDALREALDIPDGVDFNVSIAEEDISPAPAAEKPELDLAPSRVKTAARALSLLNVSYLGPILLAIAVLYFAATAARDATKEATTERLSLMQQYTELTKQQLTTASSERNHMLTIAAMLLRDANTDRLGLAETLRKLVTNEHGQSNGKLDQTVQSNAKNP